ncbi:MAG: hypothetical protein AAGD13_22945 [Pseudomonadota bacterium]
MSLWLRCAAALMAAVVLSACADSRFIDRTGRQGPAQLVYAPAGTELKLVNASNGKPSETRITVNAPTGLRGSFTREDGTTGGFYPACWGCGGSNVIEEAEYAKLWPLETGKSVGFLRTAPDGQKARVVIRVAGTASIETMAGQFDTYILDGRIEHLTGPRYSAQVRAWWAQDPGWVVKAEGGDSQGSTLSSEVASVVLP